MKRIIPVILVLIGVLFLLTPFITDQLVAYYSKSIATSDMSNEVIRRNNQALDRASQDEDEDIVDYDLTAVEDVSIMSVIKGSQNLDKELVIGSLYIPDLDINLPIMKGLNDANLMAGAATMKSKQDFGHGNYTLAGHKMKNEDLLFGSLMDIKLGSLAYVSNGETIYEYKIYETEVVPDTAMYMLDNDRADEVGKPILSLMTCL